MAVMEETPPPKSQKPARSLPEVSLQDLQDYYLDQVDEQKKQVIKARLEDPTSEVNSLLRCLRSHGSPSPPKFPRLASLPQGDIEAVEARKRFALQPQAKQHSPNLRIGPRNPDAPGVNRDGGGREPS
jgi:hypothetical protein